MPVVERYESAHLPAAFGKRYAPAGAVTLGDDAYVAATDLDVVPLDGEVLAIRADTAAWAFATGREAALLADWRGGGTFGSLRARWPTDAWGTADQFVATAFRRGLLTINGQTSIDPTVFRDGPNVREGHLVELLLSEKCNLACVYCLAGASQNMPHMHPDVGRRTVDLAFAMSEVSSFTFEFSGGEPFLRFELMRELVDYIRVHPAREERDVFFCVQTNGTLLTPERVDWLKRHAVIVGLSLDGDPRSQDVSRPQVNGQPSFARMLAGLDLLQRAGLDVGVLVVLNRANVGAVEHLVEFLVDNGITRVKVNPVAFLGTARQAWQQTGLTQDEVIAYFQSLARLLARGNHDLLEGNLSDMLRHLVSKQRHSRCLRGHCGAGDTFQTIAANGDIYPCGRATQSPGLVLGNVLTESRSLSAPARSSLVIREIRDRRPDTLEGCPTCAYRELCQAGCSAQAFERYGTVRHRTPECAFFKTMYPYLMRWLAFDEAALGYFARRGYFGGEHATLVCETYLPG